MADREELQRLARMVDLNRQKMERIEQQLSKLEAIHQEQSHVVRAVRAIPKEGAENILVPLGSGVQLVVDVQSDAGAVVDIGTAIQAEMTRYEAADLIEKRQNEISELIDSLKKESATKLERFVIAEELLAEGLASKIEFLEIKQEVEHLRGSGRC